MSERTQIITGLILSALLLALPFQHVLPAEFTLLESVGSIFCAWSVWLLARNRPLGWWIGLIGSALYAVIFYRVNLLAEVGIQVFYIITSFQAIWIWLHGGDQRQEKPVGTLNDNQRVAVLIVIVIATFLLRELLIALRGAVPAWDALTTVISITAHLLLMARLLDSWVLWITVDIIYVPLYASRGLVLTSALYAVFLLMATYGYLNFRNELKRNTEHQEEGSPNSEFRICRIAYNRSRSSPRFYLLFLTPDPWPLAPFFCILLSMLGITVGKFDPLHLGHEHLIRTALVRVDHLVVLLGDAPGRCAPAEVRAGWIRERFPGVEVIVTPEDIPEAPEPWAARALELLAGRRPDLAFTSEEYGHPWAAAMGAEAVTVDLPRSVHPISATAIRCHPDRHWSLISPPARAHFVQRVCVLGVESSGTTTLARKLAEQLQTAWVPEYGRYYWEGRRHLPGAEQWQDEEFMTIARGQRAWEDDLARISGPVLILDTDPLATVVWHRRYTGRRYPALEEFARQRLAATYLLTAPDFSFVQDGTRESEPLRAEMHSWFKEILEVYHVSWQEISGPESSRLQQAIAQIHEPAKL